MTDMQRFEGIVFSLFLVQWFGLIVSAIIATPEWFRIALYGGFTVTTAIAATGTGTVFEDPDATTGLQKYLAVPSIFLGLVALAFAPLPFLSTDGWLILSGAFLAVALVAVAVHDARNSDEGREPGVPDDPMEMVDNEP